MSINTRQISDKYHQYQANCWPSLEKGGVFRLLTQALLLDAIRIMEKIKMKNLTTEEVVTVFEGANKAVDQHVLRP